MQIKFLSFVLIVSFLIISAENIASKKDWEYTIEQVNVINNYTEEAQVELKLTRIKRGLYGISGWFILLSATVDQKAIVGVTALRSAKRDTQFVPLPMKIPSTKFYDFMNGPYKKYVMESAGACSNLPTFNGTWDKSLPNNFKYEVNNCLLSKIDQLPTHLQPGFYKIIASFESPTLHKVELVIIAEIKMKLI